MGMGAQEQGHPASVEHKGIHSPMLLCSPGWGCRKAKKKVQSHLCGGRRVKKARALKADENASELPTLVATPSPRQKQTA